MFDTGMGVVIETSGASERPATELESAPTEWIEREIGELAAHIAAATCRWLELVAEFDRRNGYEVWGFHSCGPPGWRGAARSIHVRQGSTCGWRGRFASCRRCGRSCALAGDSGVRPTGERHLVVVHVDAEALVSDEGPGRCRLDDGPAIPAETARRLSCDASLLSMLHGPKGSLDIGRKTRAIPPSMRRALQARDEGCCRFPGCDNRRWIDAHHIHHWAHGGETKLDNLILLCSHHHRLLHEGGFSVSRQGDGKLVFRRPDGRAIPPHPFPARGGCGELRASNRRANPNIGPRSSMPLGCGERMDRELAVTGLLARAGP